MQIKREWFKDFKIWNLWDVAVTSLAHKSLLVYDDLTSKWINIRAEELTVLPWKIEVDTEFLTPANRQHINIDGLEIEGQFTLSGSLVV